MVGDIPSTGTVGHPQMDPVLCPACLPGLVCREGREESDKFQLC